MKNKEENTITFLLAKCSQRSFQIGKRALAEFGVTPAQAMILNHLYDRDGISQYELGELVRKDRSTVSSILNKLEVMGLLTRLEDPYDRRKSLIYITTKGSSLKEPLAKKRGEINKILTENLTDSEICNLRIYLGKIRKKNSKEPGKDSAKSHK